MEKSIDPMLNGNAGSGIFRQLPAVIGIDESPVGYSLIGLLSSSARHHFTDRDQNALKWFCRSIDFQRTANMVLTDCLSQADNPKLP